MPLMLALLLAPAAPGLPDLDFASGRLSHWEGKGFAVVTPGAGTTYGVSSADDGKAGRTALLHRTFVVPRDAGVICFRAAAVRPAGKEPGGALDVLLEGAGRTFLPKQVRVGADDWHPARLLLPPRTGQAREYVWHVGAYAGRRLRINVVDEDGRPGCHVVCGGFEVLSADAFNAREFTARMQALRKAHKMPPVGRYASKHFLALSTAPAGFAEYRLRNCESLHAVFFEHFRRRGFAVRAPGEKLMVAIFDGPEGFEAYLGQRVPASVTGMYHPGSNRLVVYDYGRNRAFASAAARGEAALRSGPAVAEREVRMTAFGRHVRDRRDDVNLSTILHEVAHQLSFNGGLLNRGGDVPAWLAEGLACYCESTVGGAWQGVGEANPARADVLAGPARGKGKWIALRDLVRGDDWLRKATTGEQVGLGYAQSWALFDLLMKERPKELRKYLGLVYDRRGPEQRLADFAAAFGDLAKFERRYQARLAEVVRQQAR